MPVVTAIRAARGGRVAVELDGDPWRTLPLEAVVRAGLVSGTELDRSRARTLARERRRLAALEVAVRSRGRRDRTRAELAARLTARGVGAAQRDETVAVLERAGLVDDARFAAGRAEALAARGYGNAAIRADLERRGVAADAIAAAVDDLDAEAARATQHAARLGGGLRAARALARRGFDEEALEALVADAGDREIG